MNAPGVISVGAGARLLQHRDTALDRLHRMPEGWTRDLLVMTAEIANRVARYPASSREEIEALASSQEIAIRLCDRLLKSAETAALLERINPE